MENVATRIDLMDTSFNPPRPIYNMPSFVLKEVLLASNDPSMKLLNNVIKNSSASEDLHRDVLSEVLDLEYKSDIDTLKNIFRKNIEDDTNDVKKFKTLKETIGLLLLLMLLICAFLAIKTFI